MAVTALQLKIVSRLIAVMHGDYSAKLCNMHRTSVLQMNVAELALGPWGNLWPPDRWALPNQV